MKTAVKSIVESLRRISLLKETLDNPEYWINKAQKEAGFPANPIKPRIFIEIKPFKIEVSVHDDNTTKVWINGQWFNTYWPEKIPYIGNIDLNSL